MRPFGTRRNQTRRSTLLLAAGWLLLMVWWSAAWAFDERNLPENPVAGQELFLSKGCVSCHAVLGHGGVSAPDFGKIQLNQSILGIASLMWNHSPRMSAQFRKLQRKRPEFSTAEMSNLVGFLYLLNYFDTEGDARAGARVFEARRCKTCHMLGGQGGAIGPPLDYLKNYYTPIYLATFMWNSGVKMTEKMKDLNVPIPRFEGNDVANLLAFIRQVARTDEMERHYLEPGSPLRGERLFYGKGCRRCHSIYELGVINPPDARPGSSEKPAPLGPNLGKIGLRISFSGIAGKIWNHAEVMWKTMQSYNIEVPTLTPEEMGDISTYLYFLNYVDRMGDAGAGREVFVEKGCVFCHSAQDDEKIGPGLAPLTHNASPFQILAAMWNHLPDMEARLAELKFPWPRFRENEMANLITYLQSMQ